MKKITKLTAAVTAMALASVSAASLATMHFTANAAADVFNEGPYTAWLCISAGTTSVWDADAEGATPATIEEDGSYTVSYTIQEGGGSASIELLLISTDINAYAFVEEGGDPWVDGTASMAVESVEIVRVGSGEITEIEYTGPSEGAFSKENNGTDLRLNLLNTWGNDVQDITTEPEGGLAEGDTIQVNFTVSGINQMASSGEGEETETTTTAAETTTKKATTTKKTTTTTTTTTTTAATDSADESTSSTDSSYLRGDYDGDGNITITDAYNTLLAYSNISAGKDSGMTETQEAAVDVDENGKVDIQDAYKILLYYSYQSAGKTVDWDSL